MHTRLFKQVTLALAFTAATSLAFLAPAQAQSRASDASAISVVASVVLPAAFLSAGGQYVVKGVEASAEGTVYVMENLSNGVRGSVTVAANASGAASVGVGESVRFVATSAGTLLVSAGKVLAIIPTELGRALLKSDKLS